jgi:hypothetical protein
LPLAELLHRKAENPAPFFLVFAICFPAFTGMTAGVGLSGNLRDPKRAIPIGTLGATLAGMVVYLLVAYKLATTATPEMLVNHDLVMADLALWGPIIPVGLACATVSSALGSFLVAPRTLQAIAADDILPSKRLGAWLAQSRGSTQEPRNAALFTAAIASIFVILGNVDFVAQIISMFFMVTYGSLCLISFLQHFAADPAYRPTFRSRWFISLLAFCLCVWLMFKMSAVYALLSVSAMAALYVFVSSHNEDKQGLSSIIQGAIFQTSRQLQVFLQKSRKQDNVGWRPSMVCLSSASFKRLSAFDFLRWAAHHYGFGSYIHFIQGYLSRASRKEAEATLERLIHLSAVANTNVYVDTMVSPSFTTAICQVVQLPGVSGKENNLILFEYWKSDDEGLSDIIENYALVAATGFDVCILGSCDRGFGYRHEIHVWITPGDFENASLMVLMAYILVGHPDWKSAVIKVFSLIPEGGFDTSRAELEQMIRGGRLPISLTNLEVLTLTASTDRKELVCQRSRDADLTILGFHGQHLKHQQTALFHGYGEIGNILFVNTQKEIDITGNLEEIEHDDLPDDQRDAAPAVTARDAPAQPPS